MIFISVFMTLLLIGVTLWLWRLSQAQIIHFAVLVTEPRLIVCSFSRLNDLKEFAQVIPDELLRLEPVSEMYRKPVCESRCQNPENIINNPAPIIFSPPQTARYCGWVSLPKKPYADEGNSRNISLILDRVSFKQGSHPETLNIEGTATGKQVTLDIQETDNKEQFLEVQLLAAGFSTKGEEKQRQSLSQERLEYRWNCCFQNAGNHEFSLVLKIIHPSGERSLGAIEQTIRVNHLDHMTQHEVRIAAVGAATVTLLATIANLLSTVLGIWHLH